MLVNNPSVAAEVARICMLGLATTVHATRGPPKPDKARIDRLAYVVSARPFPHTPLCREACPAHTQRVDCCLAHTLRLTIACEHQLAAVFGWYLG